MNVTAIKVVAFCASAFLAGLGGALLGPVTGQLASANLSVFASLFLVVVLALQTKLSDVPAAFAAAAASIVVPAYLTDYQDLNRWLPVMFGVSAILGSLAEARPSFGSRPVGVAAEERLRRSPARARLADVAP
jgi:ABC-type branched-subunit amino acid transport system permease subunit